MNMLVTYNYMLYSFVLFTLHNLELLFVMRIFKDTVGLISVSVCMVLYTNKLVICKIKSNNKDKKLKFSHSYTIRKIFDKILKLHITNKCINIHDFMLLLVDDITK